MCRLVLDVDVESAAVCIGTVLNCADPTDGLHEIKPAVPPGPGTSARGLGVALQQVRAVANLIVEAVVVAVTGRCVGASGAHCSPESIVGRPRMSDEPLLFLQHDEQSLLAHTTGTRHLVDDGGRRLISRSLI